MILGIFSLTLYHLDIETKRQLKTVQRKLHITMERRPQRMILFAHQFSRSTLRSQHPDGGGHKVPNMRATNSIRALRVRPKP